MRGVFSLAIPLTVLALGLTACSSEPLASPAPEETVEETETQVEEEAIEDADLPSDEDLIAYVEAIASDSASELEQAEDLVLDDSAAADYLTYYLHNVNAQIDQGLPNYETANVAEIDEGFELCWDGESAECTTYTDFEGSEGKISHFQIQDRDLSERLVRGSGATVEGSDGAEIEFVAAYRNAADTDLLLAYTIRSGDTGLGGPQITYKNSDGRQSQSEVDIGAIDLEPESYSSYIAVLPAGELGGEATVSYWTEAGDSVEVELPIPEK